MSSPCYLCDQMFTNYLEHDEVIREILGAEKKTHYCAVFVLICKDCAKTMPQTAKIFYRRRSVSL